MSRDFTFNLVLNAAMQGNLFYAAGEGSKKIASLQKALSSLKNEYADSSSKLQNAINLQRQSSAMAGNIAAAYNAGRISQSAYNSEMARMNGIYSQASANAARYRQELQNVAAQQRAVSNQYAMVQFNDSVGRTVGAYQNLRGAVDTVKNIASPFVGAIETAAKFEQGMAKVKAIMGNISDTEFRTLTDQAKELGATTQFSATQASEAMSYLALAGWKTNSIAAAMPGLLSLAAASGTDLARTADIISDDMTGFGIAVANADGSVAMYKDGISNAQHFADVFAYTMSNTNTTVDMLGETMKYAAPVAKAFGASLEETSALAGLMANAGIKASQSGTALRAGFLRLAGPPKQASKAMDEMGISLQQATTEAQEAQAALRALGIESDAYGEGTKKVGPILKEIRQKTAELGKEEKLATLKTIFGTEAASGWLAVLETAPEVFDKMVEEMENADGTSEKMANTMNRTASGSMMRIKSAIESVSIAIGGMFLPQLADMGDTIATMAGSLAKWAGEHPVIIKGIVGIGAVVATATIGFFALGTAINGLEAASSGINVVTTRLITMESRLTSAAMANTVLSTRMTAISTAFSGVASSLGTFGSLLLGKVLGPFKMLGGLLGTVGSKMTSGVGRMLSGIITKIAPFGSMLMNVLGKPFAMVGRFVAPLTGMLAGPLATAFGGVIASFGGLAAAALPIIGIIAGIVAIGAVLYSNWDTIANVAEVVYNKVAGCWDAAMQRLQPAFDSIGQSIDRLGTTFSTFGGNSSILEAVFNTLGAVIAGTFMAAITIVETFIVGFSGALNTISTVINEVGVAIQAFVNGDWASAWNSMGNIVSTVVNGIISTVSNMVSSVTSGIQSILGLGGGGGGGGAEVASNAEGGIYRQGAFLTTFAEKSPEAAIPLDGSQRAIELWKQAGQMLGQPVVGGDGSVSSIGTPNISEQMSAVSALSGQLSTGMNGTALTGSNGGSGSSVMDNIKGMLSNITSGGTNNTTNNSSNSSNQTISINIPVTINGNADENTIGNMQNNIVDIVRRAMADIQNQQRRVSFA